MMQFSNNSTTALLMKMNQNNLRCKLLENAGNYRIMLAQMRYIKHALQKKNTVTLHLKSKRVKYTFKRKLFLCFIFLLPEEQSIQKNKIYSWLRKVVQLVLLQKQNESLLLYFLPTWILSSICICYGSHLIII